MIAPGLLKVATEYALSLQITMNDEFDLYYASTADFTRIITQDEYDVVIFVVAYVQIDVLEQVGKDFPGISFFVCSWKDVGR